MRNLEDEATLSVENLLEQFAVHEGGQETLRRLLLEEKKGLSSLSIQAGGDTACLEQIALIDQLLDMLDESILITSPFGVGTVSQRTRNAARGRR